MFMLPPVAPDAMGARPYKPNAWAAHGWLTRTRTALGTFPGPVGPAASPARLTSFDVLNQNGVHDFPHLPGREMPPEGVPQNSFFRLDEASIPSISRYFA